MARRLRFIVHHSSFIVLFGLCLLAPAHGDNPADLPDPVPLKRVFLTPDQLVQELDRAKSGPLVRLPRDEFEDLVRQAALAEAARKNPPRLVGAYYHAELVDNALVGSCQWKVIHTIAAPGLLPLTPLNLALRQPRFENGDAFIGDFDGREPSLLVDTPGEHAVSVEWSARSAALPEGLRFDLEFPASPAAVLELDLPPEKVPVVDDGGASGPRPAGVANLNRWTIACGGRSQVSLTIRSVDRAPVLRASLETTQTLSPEGLDATFAFALKALHQGVRELMFECDADLRPYEVDAPGLEKWEVVAAGPDDRTVLLIAHLSDPLEKGDVQVRCLGSIGGATRGPGPVLWTSPGVRLLGCVPGGETLVFKVHPDLRLADVEAGAFRLKETGTEADPDGRTEYQRLTFIGGGVTDAAGATGKADPRPRAALHPHAVEFRARQLAWWRVADPAHPALTLQTTYDVSHGRLFQLAVRLPADWEVNSVNLAPADLLRNWNVRTENGAQVLLIDLQRAVAAPHGPTLTVGLEPTRAADVLGKEMTFPDAEPLGARFREGALAIGFDERTHRVEVKTTALEAPPEGDGPWGKEVPSFYYPYREIAGRQPPAGTLTLRARAPQVRAQVTSDAILSAGQASVDTRLLLEAEQGSPESVDLYLSAPAMPAASGDPWNWRGEPGGVEPTGAHRRPGVEAAAGLGALGAGVLRAAPRGECWRLTFARPLRVHEPVLLHATLVPKVADGVVEIPLTAVLGASRLDGEATLHLASAAPLPVEAFGLREASPAPAAGPRGATAWRTFRYNGAAIGLTLLGQAPAGDRPPEGSVDRAALTTYVRPDGVLEHHYAFQVSQWSQNTLPLQMPPGARVIAFQVDGVWSARPPAVEEAQGRPVIDLPVPVRPGEQESPKPHRYEVVYTTTAAPGWLWVRVEAPAPSPPAAPAAFQRLWRLAPEFSPVGDDRLRRRPGPGEGTSSAAPPLGPGDLFRAAPAVPPVLLPWAAAWDEARRPEALAAVLLGLRAKTEQSRPLGAILNETAAALRVQYRQYLVVDAAALRDAGIDPTAVVVVKSQSSEDEAPPWDGLGLTATFTRGGCLLTTRRQLRTWSETAGTASVPEAVEAAAVEAARWGRDASGRFESAAVWADAASGDKDALPYPESAVVQWTEWETPAGAGDVDAVVVVRRPVFEAAGWALTAVLGLAFVAAAWRWKRTRLGLLLIWLAAAGLGLFWLPAALQGLAWPALMAGCICALAWRLWTAARRSAVVQAGKARAALAAAAGSAALLLLATANREVPAAAAGPTPTIVYVLPGSADAPDKPFVLVPQDLLDHLHILARPGAGPAAVLVNADYSGAVVGGTAEFTAVFEVVCFTDDPTTVALPFDGVQLTDDDVRLDGAVVKPTALPLPSLPPRAGEGAVGGFTVPIKGRFKPGDQPHRLELRFRTPVAGTEEERDVQFTAPRLAQSHLILHLPKGSAYIQASSRRGIQKSTKDDPYSLDTELGGVAGPLHVRWVPAAWLARTPEVQVREAYLWDLGVHSSTLTALLSYSIAPGGTPSLAVKLPLELEALSVEARRSKDGTTIRPRDWRVAGAGADRTLYMDFASPVSGDLDLLLELAPRSPWPASFVLPLPAPVLPPSPQTGKPGRPKASYLAYRTDGLDVERVNPVGVTGVPPVQFAPFWPASTRPDPRSLAYASTILRDDESRPPVLGLKVRPSPPATHARMDVEARVGPQQADVRATAVLTAPEDGLSLAQWRIRSAQPFTVTGVSGSNVKRWNQEGDRVLAWLEPAAKGETRLELTGWLPVASGTFSLPSIRLSSAASQDTTVRLVPGNGVALAETGRQSLAPREPKPPGGIVAYTSTGRDDYGGAWQVNTGPAEVRVYTVAGLSDHTLKFAAVVDCQPAFGGVESLTIRVRNWAGEVRLTAPAGVRSRTLQRGPGEWAWALEQDAGTPGRLRVALTGEQAADAAAAAVMPDVTIPGAAHVERWAAVAGGNLMGEPALGLAPAEGRAAPPADLIGGAEIEPLGKLVTAWAIISPEWRLNLSPRGASASAAPIEVYLADYRAGVADGRRWLHEAVYWLRHEANTDLNLTLPADAEVLSVAIDDDEAAPLQAEPRRLWLPLTGRPAVCRVRVRWRYAEEELARPNLERPTIQGAVEGPAVWTVFAPPGWEPDLGDGKAGLQPGLAQGAALAWQRAAAHYHISEGLVGQAANAGPLAEAQRRFDAECRRAREALDASGGGDAPAWPKGRGPKDVLQDLIQANKGLVKTTAEGDAQRAPEDEPGWADEGRPLYARAAAGDPAPGLTLNAVLDGRAQGAWPASATWLSVLLLIGVLSLFSPVAAWSRHLWPEQIGLVGLVGWWAAGVLTFVVLFLLLIAVCGRVLEVLFAAARFFRKSAAKAKSTASMPVAPEAGS